MTLNAQLLGGKISFFQSVCVLGYCIFPLNVAALICVAWTNVVFRAIVLSVGYLWSTRASVVFMSQMVKQERKILAVYPVLLFYIVLTWSELLSSLAEAGRKSKRSSLIRRPFFNFTQSDLLAVIS